MAFRRGNKSNKVPNVKLRPVLPNSSSSLRRAKSNASHDSSRGQDSGFDSEMEPSFVDLRTPRPFRGVILCATGIPEKLLLFKQAIELGAQPLNDLTDKVTHLLALEPGSAKYKCALQNNIPVMHPSWITDSYETWLKGDDLNLTESIQMHRLPIFSKVVLCLSSVGDDDERTEIVRRVKEEGGSCVANIERPVKVTHLLCTTGLDAMTERMRYAEKFNKQREARIRMVWQEWFWDSLKVGGRCDEDSYDVSEPRPIREPTPDPATSPPRSSSPAGQHVGVLHDACSAAGQRGADALANQDEEEVAVPLKRARAISEQLWRSIMRPRGLDVQCGKLIRSPSKARGPSRGADNTELSPTKVKPKDTSHDEPQEGVETIEQQRSVLASFQRSHSSAARRKDTSSRQQLFKKAAPDAELQYSAEESSVNSQRVETGIAGSSNSAPTKPGRSQHENVLFSGLVFCPMGEARSPQVKTAIEEAGGRVVGESSDESVTFVIVRLVSGSKFYREEADEHLRAIYRTECWLERCLSEWRVCSADEHLSFTPLKVAIPVPETQGISLSVSGLEESEACWVRRLVRALGMHFAPAFSRRTTHLLCPSRAGAKNDKAREWNIPVVGMDWLAEIASTGEVKPCHQAHLEPERAGAKGKQIMSDPLADTAPFDLDIPPTSDTLDVHTGGGANDDKAESLGEPVGLLPEALATGEEAVSANAQDATNEFRPLSLAELRNEMLHTRIPSSKTPSPMKTPTASPSPAKTSHEATRVLRESITTLLGKRNSTENAGIEQAPRLKRVRPPSRTKVIPHQDALPVLRRETRSSELYEPFGVSEEDVSMLVAEGANVDDSVRVTYEDPAQNDERMRLMRLLETQKPREIWELDSHSTISNEGKAAAGPRKKKQPPRRSSRVAGF
ncbi:hypothetical protein BC835DRAFT_1373595 [Cytidiella melzeri]|nr:hypothetical protein BC835DRAFT_1373595 [Cytidiella melzeri]